MPIYNPSGGGSGSVTEVSVVTANGVSAVVANPTTTPAITVSLGDIDPTTVSNLTITPAAVNATLTIEDGKTLEVSNSLTLTGIDASTVNFGNGGDVVYTSTPLGSLGSTTSAQLANVISDETGSNKLVFSNSPTIVTPTIASLANMTHNHTNAAGGGALTSAAISDFDTQVRTSTLNQMAQPTADVSMNSFKLTSLAAPTVSTDAATKAYADAIASGLLIKASCALASTANVAGTYVGSPTFTITAGGVGAISIDGTTPNTNDRVLLKNQSTAQENGIYVVTTVGDGGTAYVLTRATDFDADAEILTGAYTFIVGGSTNAATGFILTTPATITLDTTALTFTQFSSATNYIAGNGLTLTSLTFDVGAGTGIVANADNIAVDTTVVATTTNSLTMSNKTLTSPVLTTPTLTSGTQGSVLFLGAAGVITQNNASFFWNNTSNRLGIGTSSPVATLDILQPVSTSGSPNGFKFTGGAHTTLTASTEANDVFFNLSRNVEFSAGALSLQRAFYITPPQYSATSATTISTAATFAISNAPGNGVNVTITRPYSFLSENGSVAMTMSSNIGFILDFLGSNATGSNRSVTFKGGLTGPSTSTNFIFTSGNGVNRQAGNLAAFVNNATTRFSIAFNGAITVNQLAGTGGSPAAFNIVAGAHTTLTASVEASDVYWNLNRTVQFATGALGQQNTINILTPTYAFVGASTVTKVAGLTISAPNAGTNATFTNTTAINAGGNVALTASTAALFYTTINIPEHTVTFTGNVSMTGTSAVNGLTIGQITLTDSSAVTVSAAASLYIKNAPVAAGSVTLTNSYSLFVDAGNSRFDGRLLTALGADVTAAGDLVLGSDGNVFGVNGTTQINAITTANWTAGSIVVLIFGDTVTVKHDTAGGAGTGKIYLNGSADFNAGLLDTLTLVYEGSDWQEISRKEA